MPKPKKIGKDVTDKKGVGLIRTAKERAEYEEYKRKRAEDALEEEEKKKIGSEKMIEEREPRPEGLSLEEWAEMKALSRLKKKKTKVKIEVE